MSTYSTNLALELIGTGEQAGVWGNTTNTNLGTLIEQAISGYVTQAVATGTDTTITIPNGATGVARNMYIELTGTGGTNTNLIVPANKKLYFIFNNSTGAVTVKVSGQTGVSVPQGKKMVLVSNGTDIVNGLNYIADFGSNSATITQLTATSATITNLTLTSLVISNLSIASANITTLTATNETISGNLTLSGGTANGVLYLDGSKVATSGSAVTYNGTTFALGAAWTTNPFAGTTAPLFYQYGSGGSAIRVIGDGGAGTLSAFRFDNGASPAICLLGKARGTYASSSAVQTGDYLGEIRMNGYGGTTSRNLVNILGGVETYTSDSNISSYLEFRTSSSGAASATEKMRLTAAGNLGIGTASWPSAQRLRVAGGDVGFEGQYLYLVNADANIQMGAAQNAQIINSDSGNLLTISRTGASSAMAFSTAGSEAMRITNAQNVGIGTTTPRGNLDVSSGSGTGSQTRSIHLGYSAADFYGFRVTNINDAGATYAGTFRIQRGVGSSWSDDVVVNDSGNVGIGTTNPVNKLVVSNAGAQGFEFDPSNGIFQVYNRSTAAYGELRPYGSLIRFYTGSSPVETMRLDSSGNLGIGTASPVFGSGSGVEVERAGVATLRLENSSASNSFELYADTAVNGINLRGRDSSPMVFWTANTERMRLDANGNIIAGASAALATNATNGFLYVPTCAGTPTGTPTAITGMAPIVVDTTNNKMYFYSGGAWRDAGP